MSSKNSQCETFIPMLDAFADNELTGSEKEQVSVHVQSCDDCQRQLQEIEALKVKLSTLPQRKMRVDLADSFDFAAGNASSSPASNAAPANNVIPLKRKWVVAASCAAAVSVIAIAGAFVTKGSHQQVAVHPSSSERQIQPQKSGPTQTPEVARKDAPDTQSTHPGSKSEQAPEKVAANETDRRAVKGAEKKESLANHVPDSNSKMAVVAHDESAVASAQSNRGGSAELLALYEDDDGLSSDIGVSTDEDGLYAIKL